MTDSGKQDKALPQHAWEDTGGEASWSHVKEDEDGNLILGDEGHLSTADAIRIRRKRLEQADYSQKRKRVVRDMIRYLFVVIDASRAMVKEKDPVFPPGTRLDATIEMLQLFVQEYFDQNPLSHLGFVVVRAGEAEILAQLSSNAKAHKVSLQSLNLLTSSQSAKSSGEFSLQNGLELAGRSLGHQPRHGTREIVVICGALSTCDPGNIWTETLPRLLAANIRVSTLSLAAEMHVCRKLAEETGGVMGVALDKAHFRDWLLGGQSVPPPALQHAKDSGCQMLPMGFPEKSTDDVPTLVHVTRDTKLMTRRGYKCPQCQAKVSELPTECAVCGLKLVLAPHLARSFHHLFPVPPFEEIPLDVSLASESGTHPTVASSESGVRIFELNSSLVTSSMDFDRSCFSCSRMIGTTSAIQDNSQHRKKRGKQQQMEQGDEILRFQCPECRNVFCADCDAFLHETLHNCPGCLCRT